MFVENLYWTDEGRGTIEVSRLDGSSRYVLVHDVIDRPGRIVVDSAAGFVLRCRCRCRVYFVVDLVVAFVFRC